MDDSGKNNTSPFDKNGDGVLITERGNGSSRSALLYKIFALALVACFAAYVVKMVADANSSRRAAANSAQTQFDRAGSDEVAARSLSETPATTAPNAYITARSANARNDRNDLSNYVAPGEAPKMEDVIARLHAAGIHEGLGAFNPPGTSPPMIGLAVPDDYVLPEGYVRHFQATDDGQRIEPILMFSPDFDFFDSAGLPITIPDNRVVPSNMAPPGLPVRPIKIPEPLEPGGI